MAENTIDLEQAQIWRNNWKSSSKAWIAANDLQGFWVPGDDLSQTTAEGGENCRIYLGLTEPGTGGEAKIMIVAVDEEGRDMINEEERLYIYDFTRPIPPMGDSSSPLN